jgi:sulfoxide reductase heme-binding subunit YedZ
MAGRSKARLWAFRVFAWAALVAPLAWLARRWFQDQFGANPIEWVLHWAGDASLITLLLALAVTPFRRVTGWNEVIKIRRFLGLTAFFYITLHFGIYLGLDQFFAWSFILEDIGKRPFITVGFATWVILIPVAVTSTKGWIRRLGKRWGKLHQLVYIAGVLGVLHYYWKVKADTFLPLVAAFVLLVLFLLRLRRWPSFTVGRGAPRQRTAEG